MLSGQLAEGTEAARRLLCGFPVFPLVVLLCVCVLAYVITCAYGEEALHSWGPAFSLYISVVQTSEFP